MKILKKILKFFNLKLTKINDYQEIKSLDEITTHLIKKNKVIIFDIGANNGQSITRYKNLFSRPTIHAFEPNIDAINNIKIKHKIYKNLILNNVAVGSKNESKVFYLNASSGHSSFNRIIQGTSFLKKRSYDANISPKNYTIKN